MASSTIEATDLQQSFASIILRSALIGYSPLLVAGLLFFVSGYVPSSILCVGLVILSRFLTEWTIWARKFPKLMDEWGSSWRITVWDKVFSQVSNIRAIFDMVVDLLADAILVFLASREVIIALPVYALSQLLGTFLQGADSSKFEIQRFRLGSMALTFLSAFLMLEISGVMSQAFYSNLLGISQIGKVYAVCIIIAAKANFFCICRSGRSIILQGLNR